FLREGKYRSKVKRCHSNANNRNDELDTARLHLEVNILAYEVGIQLLESCSRERLEHTLISLAEDSKNTLAPSEAASNTKDHETVKHTVKELEDFVERNLYSRGPQLSPGVTFLLLAWAWGLRGEA